MEVKRCCIHLSVLFAFLLYVAAPGTEGCSCERLHPQQHFCGAAYVIGGKVLKREYVRINTAMPSGRPTSGHGHNTGLLGGDYGAIEPLGEKTHPYPVGGGLHRLPDEPFPEGLQPYPEDLDPLPMPEGLEPIPMPGGLRPLPQPAGLQPLQQPAGLQPLPEGLQPFHEGLEPFPQDNGGLEPLPYPEGLQPLPEGLQPHPEGLQPLPEGLQPEPQEEGIEPLPHPGGLQPNPEGSHSHEALPPLPLPEELQPSEEQEATTGITTSAPGASLVEGTDMVTTVQADKEKASNETVIAPPPIGQETGQNPVYGADERIIHPESMEAWNYKIVYTLKISHIYKTGQQEDGWKIGEEVQIDSPASSSHCGKTNFKTGKTYLIASHMSGRVSLCDWTQEHHRLTSRQKQGLKTVYGKSCDVCQIYACPTSRHCKKPKENRSTTCLYDASQVHIGNSYSPYDCVASHSRCTLRGGRRCKWQKNNDYHNCMKHQLP